MIFGIGKSWPKIQIFFGGGLGGRPGQSGAGPSGIRGAAGEVRRGLNPSGFGQDPRPGI